MAGGTANFKGQQSPLLCSSSGWALTTQQAQARPPTFPGGPVSLPLTSTPKDFSSRDTTTPCPPPFPNHPRNSLPRQKGHQQRHLHLDHHWVSTPNNLSLPKTHGRSNCKVELSLEAEVVLSLALAGILWTALQFLTLLTASNTSPTNGSTS